MPINPVRLMVARRATRCGRFRPHCPGRALTARSLRLQACPLPAKRSRNVTRRHTHISPRPYRRRAFTQGTLRQDAQARGEGRLLERFMPRWPRRGYR
eukprot:scaffold10376_cov131-Isochrysis_galbana.AAC.8